MILRPTRISTERFTFLPTTRTFVAEISDFGKEFHFEPVYDDACDEGLTLVSRMTGSEVVFVVNRTEKRDGEVVAWYLVTADPQQRHLAKVTIFND